ncbi:MAG: CHRD domain-containing protein, partial [Pirellulaceae bacterium]
GPIGSAHFHNGPIGQNGLIVRTITEDFDDGTASGVWTNDDPEPLTEDLILALLNGGLYLNVHTAENQPGEIRGQVMMKMGTSLAARLTPAQQKHDVKSEAAGTAALSLTDKGLDFKVTVDSLSGPIAAAHFHMGMTGMNGGVVRTITDDFEGNTASGTWTNSDDEPLTDGLIAALLAGDLYLNVHTPDNQPGEIRGQVHLTGGAKLKAHLTPAQQTHEVASSASATASVTWTPTGVAFRVSVDSLSGGIAAAHFHNGAAGENGGVVRTITGDFDGNTATGLWTASDPEPLTPELIQALATGNLYFNIHTAANQPGEVRGQVQLSGGVGAALQLDAGQQTHEVTSEGRGSASVTLTEAGIVFDVTAEGLSGPIVAAHFHNAPLDENGGVVRTISGDFTGNTASGLWQSSDDEALKPDFVSEFLQGNLYLNVHTMANQPGEIRGQINANGVVSTSVEQVSAEIPTTFELGQNYPNPFNPSTSIEFALKQSTHARLTVFDVTGRSVAELVNETLPAGSYSVVFDAASLPSGIYYYRLNVEGKIITRNMILLK